MSHGNKEIFSCRGIKLCVEWFQSRGHKEIVVFVPLWRKESPGPKNQISDQEILFELEREKVLVYTPSRLVGGKRLVCYDDRYILHLASKNNGVVVSNDNYRDLAQESQVFRKIIQERILMYTFVHDWFMPPDDPLGRSGPTLENFLSLLPGKQLENPPPPCPYGKKCTYGNKCRYHHPERGPLPHKSVTDQLLENCQKQLQDVKARASMGGVSGAGNEHIKGKSLSLPLQPVSAEHEPHRTKQIHRKTPLSRTCSTMLNSVPTPSAKGSENYQFPSYRSTGIGMANSSGADNLGAESRPHSQSHNNISKSRQEAQKTAGYHSTFSDFCLCQPQSQVRPMQQHQHQWGKSAGSEPCNSAAWSPTNFPYDEQIPGGERTLGAEASVNVNLHRKLERQLTLNPHCDPRLNQLHGYVPSRDHCPLVRNSSGGAHFPPSPLHHTHQNVTRITSAPDSFQRWPPSHSHGSCSHCQQPMVPQAAALLPGHCHMQLVSSMSDPQLNLAGGGEGMSSQAAGGGDTLEVSRPSTNSQGIWSLSIIPSPMSGVTPSTNLVGSYAFISLPSSRKNM